ncbi:Transmembrane osmosensor [Malassezia nana]|uniref:Transmembrane osmosensor n=1 Tax=Malassezia nana TaxID=180528 RepID=A0AAF0J2E3_9BASI|nr:Transmembrane osmosensor [Malassezia nana]
MARGFTSPLSGKSGLGTILAICAFFLAVVGWLTAFISQCTAESNGYLDRGQRHVWFTIWVELFLIIAIPIHLFMGVKRLSLLILSFLIMGTGMSVLGADIGLYASTGSLEGMGAGYLILAFANILSLIYFCLFVDGAVGGLEDKGVSFGSGVGSTPSAGGVIGTFSGSGLRNRFSMGKANPLKRNSTGVQGPSSGNFVSNTGAGISSGISSGVGATTGMVGTAGSGISNMASGAGNFSRDMISPSDRLGHDGAPAEVAIGVGSGEGAGGVPGQGQSEGVLSSDAAAAPELANNSAVPGANQDTMGSSTYPPAYPMSGSNNLAPPIMGSTLGTTLGTTPEAANVQMDSGVAAIQRAEALYTYKASEDDPTEISFNKGDILQIVDSSGKWWQAQRPNGELGIVPSNYLRML